jgi:hypothetical protein
LDTLKNKTALDLVGYGFQEARKIMFSKEAGPTMTLSSEENRAEKWSLS